MPSKLEPITVKMKRIDLHVDESGQDTRGKLFIVAIVMVEDSNGFRRFCATLERTSGKGRTKWRTAKKDSRIIYLRAVISDASSFGVTLFYAVFRETLAYDRATVESIARAIRSLNSRGSRLFVQVDGLAKKKCNTYKTDLRKRGVSVEKVRGVKDENEPLIRLADALAGAARAMLESEDSGLRKLFALATRSGILVN